MRVVIAGAGLGGLCLAQGLRGLGVDVAVYERDVAVSERPQGYRINLNRAGAAGLARCLPAPLVAAYRATAHHQSDPTVTVRTALGEAVFSRRADADLAVDRSTLRRILLAGLGDAVRFGRGVSGVDGSDAVRLADGSTDHADLVVGADGPSSLVREALVPGSGPMPLGVHGIYGRSPIDVATPDALRSRFTGYVDGVGTTLALGAWNPRSDPVRTGRTIGVDLTGVSPYLMWAAFTPQRVLGDAARLHKRALALVDGWTSAAVEPVRRAEVAATFGITLLAARAVPRWKPGRVTLLGDAAHTMSPAGGEGANTAFADAAALTTAIAHHLDGHVDLAAAIERYDHDLRARGDEALIRSWSYGVQVTNKEKTA